MKRLTTTDAFFVAYQERAGITMHLAAEIELRGRLDRADLDAAIARVLARWPVLGCTVARGFGGLRWRNGIVHPVLAVDDDPRALAAWRQGPIDPFRMPPFGVLWARRADDMHVLGIRCHHAAADGMLFLAIVGELLGGLVAAAPVEIAEDAIHPLGFGSLRRETTLAASWRHARWLSREADADRSARLALRELAPGDLATCDRRLGDAARRTIAARAAAAQVRPPWIVAAAWLRALRAWNARRGVANPTLSIEVPVSMRRGPHAMVGTGNHLTVLTLFGDASASPGDLARSLWNDYVAAIRRRDHLAIPLLGAPMRALPWSLFRRVVVTTTSTGFATSHFTWIEHEDFRAALRERSGGALVVTDQRFYTPVCLRMGVALGVMAWPDELQLALTYRQNGLSADDASELAELLVEELA